MKKKNFLFFIFTSTYRSFCCLIVSKSVASFGTIQLSILKIKIVSVSLRVNNGWDISPSNDNNDSSKYNKEKKRISK